MTILPNYIYTDILELFIKTFNNKDISIIANNELITYSLVSKYWFSTLYGLLHNNDGNCINSETSTTLQQQQDQQQNYKFKLKEDDEDGKRFFRIDLKDSLEKMLKSSSIHKRIRLSLYGCDIEKIIDKLVKFLIQVPENIEIELASVIDFNPSKYSSSNILFHFNRVDHIYCTSIQQVFNFLNSVPPKSIRYSTLDYGFPITSFIDLKFESSHPKNQINISDILFSPDKISKLLSKSNDKLQKFRLTTTILDMIKRVPLKQSDEFDSDCGNDNISRSEDESKKRKRTDDYDENENSNILAKWEYIVNKLSNDSTLKAIEINNKILSNIGELTLGDISSGYKSILSNQKSLEICEFSGPYQINDIILEGLLLNSSIKLLKFDSNLINFSNIVSKVLPFNRTIRHLEIKHYFKDISIFINCISALIQDSQNLNQFDLYSVSVGVTDNIFYDNISSCGGFQVKRSLADFDQYIKFLESNRFNVKQFNISYHTDLLITKSYQIITKSNSILNIKKSKFL